ncbi:MAG: DNA double-strand break repair nuclease NurA, partial [Anaerolineales bacterium]
MSLKFDKLVTQVQTMGRAIAHRTEDISERGQRARQVLDAADNLDLLHHKIEVVREHDAGYRGAAPHTEAINQPYPVATAPSQAVIVAVDGSQVYPDLHAAALYYLINLGYFIYYHGNGDRPVEGCEPQLYYNDTDLRERNGYGAVIQNSVVNDRRTVQEMQILTQVSLHEREYQVPLLSLMDGRLLWVAQPTVPEAAKLNDYYREAFTNFYDIHQDKRAQDGHNANLAGYVDSEDSRFLIRLLELLLLDDDEITKQKLDEPGPFEGLTDAWLLRRVLAPGERSAIMIQQSPRNKEYRRQIGDAFEIAFFYLNVGTLSNPHIARIEVPMWVVEAPGAVDEVHGLVLSQCQLTGRYPYALTRAYELAV